MIIGWVLFVVGVVLVIASGLFWYYSPYSILDRLPEASLLFSQHGVLLGFNDEASRLRPRLRRGQKLPELLPEGCELTQPLPMQKSELYEMCGAWGRLRYTRFVLLRLPWWSANQVVMRVIDDSPTREKLSVLTLELEWRSKVMDAVPMMLMVKDDRGRYRWLNRAAQEYLGCSEVGQEISDASFFSDKTIERHRVWEQRALMTGIPLRVSEIGERIERPTQVDALITSVTYDQGQRQRVLYAAQLVPERIVHEAQIRLMEMMIRQLINYMDDYVLVEDISRNVLVINRASQEVFGVPEQMLSSRALGTLLTENSLGLWRQHSHRALNEKLPFRTQDSFEISGGGKIELEGEIFPLCDERSGEVSAILYIYREPPSAQAQAQAEGQLQQSARAKSRATEEAGLLDRLTGISTRATVMDYLQAQWQIQAHRNKPLAVIIGKIDAYADYESYYGDLTAERTLVKVAQALRSALERPRDLIGRYSHDSFLLILPALSCHESREVAHRLCQQIQSLAIPFVHSPASSLVSLSLGITWCEPALEPVHTTEVLQQAQAALEQAQAQGGNQYVIAQQGE